MDNYKIKVKDEAESKEAQELFFKLGYKWHGCGKYYNRIGNYTFITAYPDEMLLRMGWGGDTDKELTLPQLRDLVVLKRNDVKDANYTYAGNPVLKLETQDYKVWDEAKQAWLEHIGSQTDLRRGLKAIPKAEKDPALISGADALRALADGKEVESLQIGLVGIHPENWLETARTRTLTIFDFISGQWCFRIKPQTIKLELELPKPFEPKEGEECWVLSETVKYKDGYKLILSHEVGNNYTFGAWRTEDEIKQVVEQLRKIRGAS
ncbi:hypothetical protein [Acinetobacter lactucae]|uniref:hypothetical protein n=1 Tax=Acinetobacter lactucae TaxID=1785128 RepID=UPI0015F3D8EE|nr:hypothetical protein [Acinetobacter lactucae]